MGRHLRWHQPLPWPFFGIREVGLFLPAGGSLTQRSGQPKVLILLDGECRVSFKGSGAFEMKPGSVLVFPRPCQHTYDALPGWKGGQLHCFAIFLCNDPLARGLDGGIEFEDFRQLVEKLLQGSFLFSPEVGRGLESIINQCCRELDRREFAFATRIYSLLIAALVSLGRAMTDERGMVQTDCSPHEHVVNSAREFIRQSVYSRVRLADVAAAVNLSEEHLGRVFKEETGESVMTCLRNRRIEMAKQLLVTSNDSVKAIAHRLAFGDTGHFCKIFRRLTGQTPLQFRRAHPGRKEH